MTQGSRRAGFLSRFFLIIFALAVVLSPRLAGRDVWTGVERIVAVGDVHGDSAQFEKLLRSAGLIDAKSKWIGGQTHLVQTGDVPDRGPDSRKVMDLLMQLEKQARRAKGYVHALIGNHEAMNMYGDLRYVHPGEFAAFKTPRSEALRDRNYEHHVETLKRNPPPEGLPEFDESYRRQWQEKHPLGYFEHRLAYAPDGKYGRWIRRHNTVIKINDVVFLHGGIGPKYASLSLQEINDQVQEELRDFSKLRGGLAIDDEGPLWYRGLAQNDSEAERAHLQAVLQQHEAEHIVMGHTPTWGTVMPRFDGKAMLIDVGLSEHYGGRLACLLIEAGRFYTLHRGKKLELPSSSGTKLLAYLKQAAALDPPPSPLEKVIQEMESKLGAE